MNKKRLVLVGIFIAVLLLILIGPVSILKKAYGLYFAIFYPEHYSNSRFCTSDRECGYSPACYCGSGSCENFVYNKLRGLEVLEGCYEPLYSRVSLAPPGLFQCKCVNNRCTEVPVEEQKAKEVLEKECTALCERIKKYGEYHALESFCHQFYDTSPWGGIPRDHCYEEENDFLSIECNTVLNGTLTVITKGICEEILK